MVEKLKKKATNQKFPSLADGRSQHQMNFHCLTL